MRNVDTKILVGIPRPRKWDGNQESRGRRVFEVQPEIPKRLKALLDGSISFVYYDRKIPSKKANMKKR